MRRIVLVVFVLTLLAMNWAALHDIIKGEPNPWMEWAFVIGSGLLLLAFLTRRIRHMV